MGEENFAKKNTLIYLNIEPKCRTGYYFLFLNLKIRKEIFPFYVPVAPDPAKMVKVMSDHSENLAKTLGGAKSGKFSQISPICLRFA